MRYYVSLVLLFGRFPHKQNWLYLTTVWQHLLAQRNDYDSPP